MWKLANCKCHQVPLWFVCRFFFLFFFLKERKGKKRKKKSRCKAIFRSKQRCSTTTQEGKRLRVRWAAQLRRRSLQTRGYTLFTPAERKLSPSVSCWEYHGARCNVGNEVTRFTAPLLHATHPSPHLIPTLFSACTHALRANAATRSSDSRTLGMTLLL